LTVLLGHTAAGTLAATGRYYNRDIWWRGFYHAHDHNQDDLENH